MATGAIIGSAVIGAAGSMMAANTQASAADRASKRQAKASDAQLAFQMQQYNDWQDIYGPIQENLSSFYQHLDPETFAASNIKLLEDQFNITQENLQRTFAQRGISSPAQQMLQQEQALTLAEDKAKVRANAPLQVAQAQQGFLNQQVVNPAASGVSGAYINQANLYGNRADQANTYAAQGYQAAGTAIAGGVKAYTQEQRYQDLLNQRNTAEMYNTTTGSEQTQMLTSQNAGF